MSTLFELRAVSKSFQQQKVLDDVSLSIAAGRTTVIIGPSGCGKTVLLKHLIGLLKPDTGQVYFDAQRIDNLSEAQLLPVRRRCGFLFQAGALFDSQTVAQNVSLPLQLHTEHPQEEIDSLVSEKLAMVSLAGMENKYPGELSGGQQQRVALARAIALSPTAILYDEPTTGLDPIRSDTINEVILKLKHQLQVTSVAVTHDMNSAYKIADRIVMLDQGRIIADASPDDIRTNTDERVRHFVTGSGRADA